MIRKTKALYPPFLNRILDQFYMLLSFIASTIQVAFFSFSQVPLLFTTLALYDFTLIFAIYYKKFALIKSK